MARRRRAVVEPGMLGSASRIGRIPGQPSVLGSMEAGWLESVRTIVRITSRRTRR
jgi:hypothetical protein